MEADFYLTDAYAQFFENNTYNKLLLLSATVTPDKKAYFLDRIAPICYSFTTQEAQKLEILNDSQINFVTYHLDIQKNIEIKMKNGKSFLQSENEMYVYLQKMVIEKWIEFVEVQENLSHSPSQYMAAKKKFEYAVNNRSSFLWSLKSGVIAAQHIGKKRVKAGHKVVVFANRTEQADKLSSNTLHSKNKKGNQVIEQFNSGIIKSMAVVDVINRGENLVGLDTLIFESFNSSPTSFQQRHGRNPLPLFI